MKHSITLIVLVNLTLVFGVARQVRAQWGIEVSFFEDPPPTLLGDDTFILGEWFDYSPHGPYELTIDWGDGYSSPGFVSGPPGTFWGSHVYSEPGCYPGEFWLEDLGGELPGGFVDAFLGMFHASVREWDVPPPPTPPTYDIEVSIPVNNLVTLANVPCGINGNWNDPSPHGPYQGVVNWGEESGIPEPLALGADTFSDTHSYTSKGFYFGSVEITDDFDSDSGSAGFQVTVLEIGDDQNHAFMPEAELTPEGAFQFLDVPGACWFDPVLASGYIYETDGNSNFIEVGMPVALGDTDGMYTITDAINGTVVLPEGGMHTFPSPVDLFEVTGIDPGVDGSDPSAFPTYLAFDQPNVTFTMLPIPEPSTLFLAALGLLCLCQRRCENGVNRPV